MKLNQILLIMLLFAIVGAAQAESRNEANSERLYSATYSAAVYGSTNYTAVDGITLVSQGRSSDVPEPGGWSMLLVGLGLVIFQVRRRSKRNKSWDESKDADVEFK